MPGLLESVELALGVGQPVAIGGGKPKRLSKKNMKGCGRPAPGAPTPPGPGVPGNPPPASPLGPGWNPAPTPAKLLFAATRYCSRRLCYREKVTEIQLYSLEVDENFRCKISKFWINY